MRAFCKHFLANKLAEQNGTFGTTRRAKPSAFTRKRQQVFILAGRTSDSCKPILEVATIQILFHYTGDQTPPLSVMLFKAKIVLAYKTIEVVKEYRIKGSLLRVSAPVDSLSFVSTMLPHARQVVSKFGLERDESISRALLYYAEKLKPERATQIVGGLKRPYSKGKIHVMDPLSYFRAR